ncbi:MAG: YciI family protein [Trebonia sp.]
MDTPEGAKQYESNKEWYAEVGAWYEKMGAAGKLADGGAQLQGTNTAKTVRGSGVTDGPYIETKEVVGGFSVLDVASMDEAVEIAKTWPGVDRGWITIELRPIVEMG